MSKKALQPDIVDLSEWLSLVEATEARIKIKRPLSKQRLYDLAKSGIVSARDIKGVQCWKRAELLAFKGKAGRPSKIEQEAKDGSVQPRRKAA
ncbi:MAG: hypothetical protein AB7U82_27705 [Blastocatellales bacterium]